MDGSRVSDLKHHRLPATVSILHTISKNDIIPLVQKHYCALGLGLRSQLKDVRDRIRAGVNGSNVFGKKCFRASVVSKNPVKVLFFQYHSCKNPSRIKQMIVVAEVHIVTITDTDFTVRACYV